MTRSDFINAMFLYSEDQAIQMISARPETYDNNDCDVIVREKDLPKIISFIEKKACTITSFYERADGITIFIVLQESLQSLQIDFITSLHFKNISYLSVEEVILRSYYDPALTRRILDNRDQAIVLTIMKIKHKGKTKKAHDIFIQQQIAQDSNAYILSLSNIMGEKAALDIIEDYRIQRAWKTAYYIQNFYKKSWQKHGMLFFLYIFLYYIQIIRIILKPKLNVIAFYGIDGSGKTTHIRNILPYVKNLAKDFSYNHFLPNIENNGKIDDKPNKTPHAMPNRGLVASLLKISFYSFRYMMFYLRPRRQSEIAVFDRYSEDICIDPKRLRLGLKSNVLTFIVKYFFKKPAIAIWLNIDPNIAIIRKNEITLSEAVRQQKLYAQLLKNNRNLLIVNGSDPININTDKIMSFIIPLLSNHAKYNLSKYLQRYKNDAVQ